MTDDARAAHKAADVISAKREALHAGSPGTRQLTPRTHYTGLVGEFAFSERYGYAVDIRPRVRGDQGVDFTVEMRFTVDVKTRNPRDGPIDLLVETDKAPADIYVLAVDMGRWVNMIGWIWGSKARTYPVCVLRNGIRDHLVPAADLRPMEELDSRIVNQWRK